MTLKQLLYFVRTVETGSMTRAALAVHIAQPALSQQIAYLEEDLGVQLLVRGPRGVSPTAEGSTLYGQAQTVLRQITSIRGLLTRNEQAIAGAVSVGMASSTARMLALPLIRTVDQQYPGIDLEIVDVPSAELTLMAQQGRVDISLSPDQEEVPDLTVTPLVTEELLILTHPDVHLPTTSISIVDLKDVPLILPRPPNRLRMRIDHAFMNARLRYRLLAQASTSAILMPAVAEGMAATILPYSAAYHDIDSHRVCAYRLDPPMSRTISSCVNSSVMGRTAVAAVMTAIRAVSRGLIDDDRWQYCRMAQ